MMLTDGEGESQTGLAVELGEGCVQRRGRKDLAKGAKIKTVMARECEAFA
jgi:hypothetical protein